MRFDILAQLGLEPHDGVGATRRGRLPDTGPSAARYLTVLTLTVGLVVAIVAVTPGIGHGVRAGLCGAGDTACPRYAISPASFGDCQVLSHADTVTDDAVVFTDDLGRSGRLTLSRTVDKNAVVHWFVRQDDDSADDSSADSSATETNGAGGRLTEFASEDAAREYIIQQQHQPVRVKLARADPTGLLTRLADTVDGHPPATSNPSAYFVDGGGGLDLAGEARSGVSGHPISGGQAGIAEVKTGAGGHAASTVYVQLSAAAGQALGLLPADPNQVPSASGLAVASVAYDWTGQAQRLTVEAAGRLPGALGPPFGQTATDIMAGLLSPGPSTGPDPALGTGSGTSGDGRFTGRVSISVPLDTDPAVADAAADALHAIGVPLLLGLGTGAGAARGSGSASVLRFYRMLDRGTADGSVTVNTYVNPAAGSGGRPSVSLGLQGGLTIAGLLPAADFYYAPQQGFVEWQRCSPAPQQTPQQAPVQAPASTAVTEPPGAPTPRLAFTLPAGYQLSSARLTDDGGIVHTWRMPLAKGGPYCVIVAGQQPNYRGDFPAAAIDAFRVGRDRGVDIEADAALAPIPGTVAGLRQAMSYVFSRGADGNAPGELRARQYLTPDHTLVSLNATGPAEDVTLCQLGPLVSSLRVTGP